MKSLQTISTLLIIILFSSTIGFAQQKIQLEDVQGSLGTFRQRNISGFHSLNDGKHYSQKIGNQIVEFSYKTGELTRVIFDLDKVEDCEIKNFSSYTFSPLEDKILLCTDVEYIYRRTFKANYYIWNIKNNTLSPLSANGKQMAATFSPNGEHLAFARDNNLFIHSIKTKNELKITEDGEFNKIINGIPDWVYEEEFAMDKAFAWSPNSKHLAYVKFDESKVKTFSMKMFKGLKPSINSNELYPTDYNFKYPKAGEENSTVSAYTYELDSNSTIKCSVGDNTDQYIPRLNWTADSKELLIMRLNRHQNQLDILSCNPYTGDSKTFITERNKKYIAESFLDSFKALPTNDYFVLISERDGYSHLYLYNRKGSLARQLTLGNYDVTDFYGYDTKTKNFYYQAAKVNAMQREIYAVSIDGKKDTKLSSLAGTNNAVFSKNYNYFINKFSNIKTPLFISLHNNKGKQIRVLEENAELQKRLAKYKIPEKEFLLINNSEGLPLNAWMIKPANFNANKKYPVVMTQYSGPNSQRVLDHFGIDWYNYLAQEGFVVVCVDPRGTGARGEDFRKCTYMQLGKLESDDQIDAAKYLAKLPYVDENNIAIWGWSYGGFMTLLCLEKGNDVFKSGISIAPVTHWKYYDTVYTERYMRTPQENESGYNQNSPLLYPEKITGSLLLVHGTADDNVHYQNALEMSEALVQADIPFDMAIYTNRNHSIYGGNTRMHLYKKFTQFLKRTLQ